MRKFRLLKESEIEVRVADIDKAGRWVNLLLYKTARTDAALLDEVYGPEGWQNDYKVLDGRLFCGIGVRSDLVALPVSVNAKRAEMIESWVWKWNVGTESNMEAEKGQASDAFKRAGFMLGIGAELYSAPRIQVFADKCNIKEHGGKYRCYDKFTVEKIAYDETGAISGLAILANGKRCFVWQRG